MNICDKILINRNNNNFILEVDSGKKLFYKDLLKIKSKSPLLSARYKSNVLVVLPNSIEYIKVMLSTLSQGHVFCPIPYFSGINEVDSVVNFLQPNYIFTDRKEIQELIKKKYSRIKKNLFVSNKINNLSKFLTKKTACIYYSSGTTGNPKAVMFTHENIFFLITSIIKHFSFSKNDNQLTFLPFGHTASINYNIFPSLFLQNNLFISKSFEAINVNFFSILKKYSITYTQVVPTIIFLLNKMNLKKEKLNKLKFIGCGSSVLPLPSQKKFINKYNIKLSNLYGLSETGPTHFDNPLAKNWKPGSIGIPLDVNKIKIIKKVIFIKGKNIFENYFKNSKLYKLVVTNKWFNTGDLGYKKNGFFFYLDRKKDLIIKGGINIYPSEIEDIVYNLSFVEECAVIPIKNDILGEEIGIVIKVKKEYMMSKKEKTMISEITKVCSEKLSNYKIPTTFFFKRNLIKTHSKKISRSKIKNTIL
ncbi:acyl--CoA ligase [Pelagibacteraceae bacterium]|nr:acyl--CoA ligase [Pelagibacteraceae bacterium]